MPFTSSFIRPAIALKANAVKNILFRASTIALQFAILKFCAYVAHLTNEYTSLLMFAEDFIQQSLFIVSRGVQRSAIIVLIFTISFTLASMYDTLLWALDSPGYVVRSDLVNGSAATPSLLRNPSYVSIISDPDRDPNRIDIDESLTSNLFRPGFNFSLAQSNYSRAPSAIIPPPPINISVSWGPRIYLPDEDGLGLSFGPRPLTEDTYCTASVGEDGSYAFWDCNISAVEASVFVDQPVGRPIIWWNDDWNMYLMPSDTDDPWASLSRSARGTAAMKQVFTLTKGNKRHTFLQTTSKFSLNVAAPEVIPEYEIAALIRRSLMLFSGDASQASVYTKACVDAQVNGTNIITRGFMFQNATYPAMSLTSIDFVNYMWLGRKLNGILRISHTAVELFRSETIPIPVQPTIPCEGGNYNLATGGRIRSNNCFPKSRGNFTSTYFAGQVDTSATVIITDVLGDGTSDTNTVAFNMTGEEWYMANRERIDQLLLSRAFLVGGDADSVRVAVHHNTPAISYLQLILIILPFFIALLAYVLMLRDKKGYYNSSLFASLVTTTSTGDKPRESVGYITKPPTFILRKSGIGTEDGPIVIGDEDQLEKEPQHGEGVGTTREVTRLLITEEYGSSSSG